MIITIVANDPGTKNYGFSIVKFKKSGRTIKFKVVKTSKLSSTVDIKNGNVQEEIESYLQDVANEIGDVQNTHMIAERYMTRGIKGPLVESVNMMLGVLAYASRAPITFVPAVVWKNRVNKFFDLKEFYKKARVEAHEIDATLMAFFLAEKVFKQDILNRFAKASNRNKLLKVIEKCSTSPLKKKKKKKQSRARLRRK